MKNALLILILTYTSISTANDLGMIEGFSISKVQTYESPTGNKKAKIAREEIRIPIKIMEIGPKKKYYKINLQGNPVWVKKRNVISSNIKIECLTLTSTMNRHVAGSKALTSEDCS